MASDRTFAFAAALTAQPGPGTLGRLRLIQAEGRGSLDSPSLFSLLHQRTEFARMVAPGWRLEVEWK